MGSKSCHQFSAHGKNLMNPFFSLCIKWDCIINEAALVEAATAAGHTAPPGKPQPLQGTSTKAYYTITNSLSNNLGEFASHRITARVPFINYVKDVMHLFFHQIWKKNVCFCFFHQISWKTTKNNTVFKMKMPLPYWRGFKNREFLWCLGRRVWWHVWGSSKMNKGKVGEVFYEWPPSTTMY